MMIGSKASSRSALISAFATSAVVLARPGLDRLGRSARALRVSLRIGSLKDDHEAVPGRLVDVPAVVHDLVEKRAEVALDQPVHVVQLHPGAESRVAGD